MQDEKREKKGAEIKNIDHNKPGTNSRTENGGGRLGRGERVMRQDDRKSG